MGQQENLATISAIYAAFGRGDVDAILEHVADDVDWMADSTAAMAPWHGRRTSKDDVARFFAEVAQSLEVTEFTPVAMAAGENEVFAFLRFGFRSPSSGKEGTTNLHHYWRLHDGKVEYYRGAEDTALTAQVLDLEVAAPA
jgi:hypothetical protein